MSLLGYPYCRGRIGPFVSRDRGQYDRARPIFWASGACLAVRAADFGEVGGFREDFFMYMEEIDLCWRIRKELGREIYACPSAVVYHRGSSQSPLLDGYKGFYTLRNNYLMLRQHRPYVLPVRFALDFLLCAAYLPLGKAQPLKTFLRSLYALLRAPATTTS